MRFAFLFLLLSQLSYAQNEAKPEGSKILPMREVSVIVTKEGYYPKTLSVFEGEKIKFYITSTIEEPNCLIVESHKVFMAATKGKVTEGEAVFDKPGEFAFYCPGSKNDGKVVVIRKMVQKREIASEKDEPQVWMPKEY